MSRQNSFMNAKWVQSNCCFHYISTEFSHRNSVIRISLVHILHPRPVQYWLLYYTMTGITKLCLHILRPFSFKYKKLYPNTNLAFPSKNDLKFIVFWEGHKNLNQSPSRFWSKPKRGLGQLFVAFLEYLNFISHQYFILFVWTDVYWRKKSRAFEK